MRLQATAVVDERGRLTLNVQTDLPPGELDVSVLLPEEEAKQPVKPFTWPVFSVGKIPPGFSLAREDLYDDWGR